MASEFIFTMRNLGRFYPPDREVLKDVTLAFIPGAKIGVLGHNGAGKSSVLKIMAGIDDGFTGEARLSPGFSVGLLEQEPGLDEDKNVIENIMEGVAETQSLIDRYNEVLAMWGDPEADLEEVAQCKQTSKIEFNPLTLGTSKDKWKSLWTHSEFLQRKVRSANYLAAKSEELPSAVFCWHGQICFS